MLVLVASYFFYGWWSWGFMGLLMLSTLLDYTYGFWVASPNRKKAKLFLWLGIINNLGILGVFKYYNFFATQFQHGFELIGWHVNPVLLNIALPVGISFYTFHGMSYVFDIYRGQQKPVKNFVEYAVFVSFFPLLVAGPIERASHLLPQVQRKRLFDFNNAVAGFELIVWGFFKKVVVADNLAPAVNDIFGQYSNSDSLTLIGGAMYFSFQIYGDFSGYSDIARGVAKLLGFELLLNFNNPYSSRSIPEFWKKWHISLSSWFRDYLYIPLGGSRSGLIKTIRNVLIIFIVSGFWHGANWTYLFWGLIHGLCFVPSLLRKNKDEQQITHANWWSRFIYLKDIALTFSITTIAWIFFRSETVDQGFNYIIGMFNQLPSLGKFISWRSESTEGSHVEFLFILLLFASADLIRRSKRTVIKTAVLIVLTIFFGSFINPSDFIYFQF